MDYGHSQADKKLKDLEKKIKHEYQEASKAVSEKARKSLRQFEKELKEKELLVKNGVLSEEGFKKWKSGYMTKHQQLVDLSKTLTEDMLHANSIAIGLINNSDIDVYALNFNFGTYEIENGLKINTSFTLYDHKTVERLFRDGDASFMPIRQDIPKDRRWNRKLVTSAITQGILAGDSVNGIAKRLKDVTGMNYSSAIRNARTWTTAAENAGRVDSYKRAEGLGIKMGQQWMATIDGRTRKSHAHMDGEIAKVGETFSNGCEYPGDPNGPSEEIYNCRCTLVAAIDGFDNDLSDLSSRFTRLDEPMTYDEWVEHCK